MIAASSIRNSLNDLHPAAQLFVRFGDDQLPLVLQL